MKILKIVRVEKIYVGLNKLACKSCRLGKKTYYKFLRFPSAYRYMYLSRNEKRTMQCVHCYF